MNCLRLLTSRSCFYTLLALVLLVGISIPAAAQQTQLSGVVTDPSGAVVPNAAITIVNTATGAQREVTSDHDGRYTLAQVTPGTYKLTAKAAGFADVVINNLELLVNQPATIPLAFEKIGATSTVVSVEAAAQQVNTTDATLGNTINTTQIMELPQFARNVASLLALQPGVTLAGSTGDSRSGAVNGGKPDQGNISLDGVDVNDQNGRAAFTSVLRVTLDSVEEFRSTTSNGNADMGRSSGANIALVTRSGTNEIHGAAYEYHRNTVTAANDFFNNRVGVARPPLLINVFGMRLGGPIVKNRTFMFFNYEGRRDRSSNNQTRTVPSDDLRNGIVHYIDSSKATRTLLPADIKNIVDPLHIGANAGVMSLFNNVYPRANDYSLGDTFNFVGYRFSAPAAADQNTYIARLDHRIDNAGKHTLFFRGSLQNDSSNGAPQYPGTPPLSVSLANNKGFAVGYTALLSNNLVSTFRYGYTRAGGETTRMA
jgi:hypothetical protein